MQTGKEKEETLAELESKIRDYVSRIAFIADMKTVIWRLNLNP